MAESELINSVEGDLVGWKGHNPFSGSAFHAPQAFTAVLSLLASQSRIWSLRMSSLSDAERIHRWARQLRQLQRNPWWVWGSLVGGVLVATLIRWALGGLVHDRIPFTTYYPAIVAATLFGGFWRGVLASILSAVLAWWLFMPPAFGFALDQ